MGLAGKMRNELDAYRNEHTQAMHYTGFWGKRAAGCLFLAKSTNRIMIAHRSSAVLEPNTWGTIGGALDSDESPDSGVIREIKEETGYTGSVELIELSVFEHESGFKYHNFLAIVDNEFTPELNWETQEISWFDYGTWPHPLHPGLELALSLQSNLDIIKQHIKK